MIPNHVSAKLSELDLRMVSAVPPGGNWRDIPLDVPSKRLDQIRVSAAAGEGSRSTYYGRLVPENPSFTIGTYYNRPGNGCFVHYDASAGQHRTISHREAARLQSFPDSFVFEGPHRAICQQIGNAVPPLLAYQVARLLGSPGSTVDVFSGAGGLALGFEWAGWQPIAAVDHDRHAIATFNRNIKDVAFVGDMNSSEVLDRLERSCGYAKRPLALLGGPPCQGFSTGGARRSVTDDRNHLYKAYTAILGRIKPDVFIFENVLGLLSLDGGRFVNRVLSELNGAGYDVALWRLNAARYGVPQRRERVIIVGVPKGKALPKQPLAWTSPTSPGLLGEPQVSGVRDALSDLPAIGAGEDGSSLGYRTPPTSDYQRLVRGVISHAAYVEGGSTYDSRERRGALSVSAVDA